jgi:hypothetical protein
MKKITLLMCVGLMITSCAQKHVGDVLLNKINERYGVFANADTLGDGTLFYSISLRGKNFLANEKNIIGLIDKTLNKVPDEVKEGQTGHGEKYRYNSYKWNTPEIKLDVQSNFYYSGDRTKDSAYIRFWMNKK